VAVKAAWQKRRLGDLLEVQNGYAFDATAFSTSKGVPLIRIRDLKGGTETETRFTGVYDRKYLVNSGDLLIGMDGEFGCYEWRGSSALLNQRVCRLQGFASELVPRFLFHGVNSHLKEIEEVTGYTTVKHLSSKQVLSIDFPIPPIPEQRRIVGILDEAFEGIATAKANAEKNLQNARALFESHLQSVFTDRGAEWERVTLEILLQRGWILSHLDGNHGSDYPRKDEFITEGVPYISANCVDNDQVDMTRAKHLSPSRAALLRKGIAQDDDVLFAHNATVGPVAILHTEEKKVILGTSLTYYRCNRSRILPEYLAHYMRSFGFKSQYLQVMRQSTRNQIPITKQREFFHVIPPISEQKTIVGQLDGLLENGQRLASIYQQKLAALDELKKSLLHQAFSGQL
jgi:type I restriction enzyme, S subunit